MSLEVPFCWNKFIENKSDSCSQIALGNGIAELIEIDLRVLRPVYAARV